MSGYPNWNFEMFNKTADALRGVGYHVINPADFGANPDETWSQCLKRDLAVLFHCEHVITIDGWENSRGARLEVHVARELGIPVTPFDVFVFERAMQCSTASSAGCRDGSDTALGTSWAGSFVPSSRDANTHGQDGTKIIQACGCDRIARWPDPSPGDIVAN
jgi:hypothetical protein